MNLKDFLNVPHIWYFTFYVLKGISNNFSVDGGTVYKKWTVHGTMRVAYEVICTVHCFEVYLHPPKNYFRYSLLSFYIKKKLIINVKYQV